MKKSKAYKITVYIVLSILTVIFIYPYVNMILRSLMSDVEINQYPPRWFPSKLEFGNYKRMLTALGELGASGAGDNLLTRFLGNTLFVMVFKTIGEILSCTLCAYGFAKINFKGKKILFILILSTIMIPGSVTMIPLFTLYKNFGWLDTLNPLWIPVWFGGGAMNIFMMRQFMKTIPNTMLDSAYLDGAGHLRTYWSIILPNVKPMMFLLLISSVSAAWGDWFQPMLYITSREKWTISLAVQSMVRNDAFSGNGGATNVLMAVCFVMSLVPLTTFALGQKNYVENVTITGIKG